jgi:hypothetical protein
MCNWHKSIMFNVTSQEMFAECMFGVSLCLDFKFVTAIWYFTPHNLDSRPVLLQKIYSRYFRNGGISYPPTCFVNGEFYNRLCPLVDVYIVNFVFGLVSYHSGNTDWELQRPVTVRCHKYSQVAGARDAAAPGSRVQGDGKMNIWSKKFHFLRSINFKLLCEIKRNSTNNSDCFWIS